VKMCEGIKLPLWVLVGVWPRNSVLNGVFEIRMDNGQFWWFDVDLSVWVFLIKNVLILCCGKLPITGQNLAVKG